MKDEIQVPFSFKELAVLHEMISIALLSGNVDFDKTSESVYQKIAKTIQDYSGTEMLKSRDMIGETKESENKCEQREEGGDRR